jgi:hypothetical protein
LVFPQFTDRLAHRVSRNLEYLPIDPAERRAWNLPNHIFRVGIGNHWPALAEDGLLRKNKTGEARPTVNECHISNWLIPEAVARTGPRTEFKSMKDAAAALSGPGRAWLDLLRNCESALALLERRDWELFWSYPMMRGYGASSSSRCLVYTAYLNLLLGKMPEYEDHIRGAIESLHG